jgi:hypothetical protein
MDGPTNVSLDAMGVKTVAELLALPTAEIAARLGKAPFPPSEKLIGAVLLRAVDDLRESTADLARSSRQMDEKTKTLVWIAGLTLAVAVVSVLASIIAIN